MRNIKDISTRLKLAKKKLGNKDSDKDRPNTSYLGNAFKISSELIASVVVGTLIGFILDEWFDTKPWLIIIFFFFGVIAGIINVIKSAKIMNKGNDN